MADGNVKWYSHFEKVCPFLKKLNINLPYDPAIPLKKNETWSHEDLM